MNGMQLKMRTKKTKKVLKPNQRRDLINRIKAHLGNGHNTGRGRLDKVARADLMDLYDVSRSAIYKLEKQVGDEMHGKAYNNLEKEEVESITLMVPSPEERDKDLAEQAEWNRQAGAVPPTNTHDNTPLPGNDLKPPQTGSAWGPLAKDIGQLMGMVKRAEREARQAKEEIIRFRAAATMTLSEFFDFFLDMETFHDLCKARAGSWVRMLGGEETK